MHFDMKKYYLILLVSVLSTVSLPAQVLISSDPAIANKPDPSAVLQIAANNRGVRFPQVPLLSNTDNVTVPTPVNGLVVHNTNTDQLNFWEDNHWNRMFGINDALPLIKVTQNFSASSAGSTTISTFPASMPLFTLNQSTSGWTAVNSSTTITVTKPVNTNYIVCEGMAQIDNDSNIYQEFQFAIGVFVDGQLKIARKFTAIGNSYVCNWRKFNLSGVFDNLSVGTHSVAVYAYNLPKITTGYTKIVYGGNTPNCDNINNDMARIFITAQLTE